MTSWGFLISLLINFSTSHLQFSEFKYFQIIELPNCHIILYHKNIVFSTLLNHLLRPQACLHLTNMSFSQQVHTKT